MKNNVLTVENITISVVKNNEEDFICISDIAKAKIGISKSDDVIRNWLRNRTTLEFLGTWEKYTIQILNPSNSTGLN